MGQSRAARKATRLANAPPAPVLPSRAAGISGTTNWRGDPLAESNSNLLFQAAYGQAGQRSWGEWEEIARTDPDISTVLDFVVAPLRDARVDIEPAVHPDIPPAVAQAQADFVRRQLLEASEPRWPDVLEQMVRGKLTFGFSLHEVVLGDCVDPSLPGGRGWGLKRLADRLPSSISPTNGWVEETLPDGTRDLSFVRQTGQRTDSPGGMGWDSDIRVPASKLLLLTHNRTGNNYRGFSAFRPVWYIARQRREILKAVGIGVVRESMGVPVATAKDANSILTPGQRKSLSRLLSNLVAHENASIVMPNGWDLNWVYSPGANKGHVIDVYNSLGHLILRQLGAQQIALGSGSTGSRSVGEVHNAVAQGMFQGIAASVESVLNGTGSRPYTGLTRKLIEPNWGPMPAYPVINLTLKRSQLSPKEKMDAIAVAVTAGALTITASDENDIREELSLSPLDPAERDAARAKLKPIAPATALPAAHLSRADTAPWTPKRPLRPSEQRVDFAAADNFLNRARVDGERLFRPAVVEMLVSAQPAIAAAMADGDASDVATVPLLTARLAETVKRYLATVRAEGGKQVRKELSRGTGPAIAEKRAAGDQSFAPVRRMASGDLSEATEPRFSTGERVRSLVEHMKGMRGATGRVTESHAGAPPFYAIQFDGSAQAHKWLSESEIQAISSSTSSQPFAMSVRLASGDDKDPPSADIVTETDDMMDASGTALMRRIEARLRQELEREAIDTLRTGGDAHDVISRTVANQLETGAFKGDAGSVLTRVWNLGRDEAARLVGGVTSVELSALLDGGTCSACAAADGETAPFNSPEHDRLLPPLRDCDGGPNCRCLLVFLQGADGGDE